MKAIKALPLHWEKTDGYYTYTPVVIIATDGKSEKCILSTIHIFITILLMTETCKNYDMTEDKQVCQEFLDADYEIVERADGIFEVVYNEKHYPLNERIRISYQSTPQEEAEAKAAEERILKDEEVHLYGLVTAPGLSPEEKESLEAKGKAFIEASRACLKALPELSHEEKARLEAERKVADEAYQEYLKPLREAEGIKIEKDTLVFLSKEERDRLSAKAKVALEANRAYLKALLGPSSEEKARLKAKYEAAYEVYREYLKPLLEAEEKIIDAETKAADEEQEHYKLSSEEEEWLEAEAKAADEYLNTLPTPEDEI